MPTWSSSFPGWRVLVHSTQSPKVTDTPGVKLVFLQLRSVLSLLKIKSEMHWRLKQHSPASQIRVCPWVAKISLHNALQTPPPSPAQLQGWQYPSAICQSTGIPRKGQSKDAKGFMLKTPAYYFLLSLQQGPARRHLLPRPSLIKLQQNFTEHSFNSLCFLPFLAGKGTFDSLAV